MSRLEELIQKLCPDGVEYRTLSEVLLSYTDGMHNLPNTISYGRYPILSAQNINAGHIDLTTSRYVSEDTFQSENKRTNVQRGDVLLTIVGAIGRVAVVDSDLKALFQRSVCVMRPNFDMINSKYLKYSLELSKTQNYIQANAHGAAQKGIYLEQVAKIQIPLPPLPMQQEIVRILDSFTQLEAELEAELEARKKQYEYYRDKLLTFEGQNDIQWCILGELFDFRNGLNKGKEFFGSGTPFIRYTDVYNHRALRSKDISAYVECTDDEQKKLRVSRGDVLFTRTSETAEDVGWSSVMLEDIGDCVFNGFTIKATPKTDALLPEYCAYCFSSNQFRRYVTSHCAFTTRASLTGTTIAAYKLPVPSIETQKRIAGILNNFEYLCNDLTSGLPAEIEARQKQYEYYRDKLLDFPEKGA